MRLTASLRDLEGLLTTSSSDLAELSRLGDPPHLELLFQVQLATLVRRGPDAGAPAPGRLVALADEAAAAGVLPLATPASLRATLRELTERLQEAGAWDPAVPVWWDPLPPPGRAETLWNDSPEPALPSPAKRAAALTEGTSRWLSLPAFLDTEWTAGVFHGLESSGLELEPGAVGAAGRQTVRRSDQVRYFSGFEPWLLAASPSLAAFVQRALRSLAGGLRIGERRVYPPRQAMLARYPAPSGGYAPHLDNPGGEHDSDRFQDNGRAYTLVIYLNGPGHECVGGEIALWAAGTKTTEPPAAVLAPLSGSAVLFDSRAIAHQVRPLASGPPRWALTLWLNDAPQVPVAAPPPRPGLTDVLLPIASPPLPAETVLFHELDDARPSGNVAVLSTRGAKPPRVGVVATVYREGSRLDAWCAHHLAAGADHLLLIFDHLEEEGEAAVARRLRQRHGQDRLTIWSGAAAAERWPSLPQSGAVRELRRFAQLGGSSYAVASRQTLNASVALAAARGDELGGAPLDWLVHLDADELFHLEGSGRGGTTLADHFAAASAAGLDLLRYANHELLLPYDPASPRFKINPRLAAARLGPGGWRSLVEHLAMAQADPRPWFNGYFNGKSAVKVAAGTAAAGVHGWHVAGDAAAQRFLAGPSVLHFHFSTPEAFRAKYLAIAASPAPARGLFELSTAEEATVALIRELERKGAGAAAVTRRLDELHRRLTHFSESDVELLEEAGLLLRPELEHVLDRS